MKILIISEYIAPTNAIASLRWTKLSKYLARDHGHQIDILTNSKCYDGKRMTGSQYAYDELLARDLSYFNKVYEFKDDLLIKATNIAKSLFKKLSSARATRPKATKEAAPSPRRPRKGNDRNPIPSAMDSLNEAFMSTRESSFIKQALKMDIPWDEYDVIISSYGPQWPHKLARKIKEHHPDLKWIADYRDAPAYSKRTMTEAKINFGRTVTDLADCVLTVSPLEHMALNIAEGQRHEVVPNGFDGEESANRIRRRSDKFLITYTGTLYNDGEANSDLRPLFQALSDLILNKEICAKDIEVRYYGMSEGGFRNQASDFSDIHWTCNGAVPRREALSVQEESSILAMCTWNTEYARGIITGKVFEYFSSGCPIVCICSGNTKGALSKEMIQTARAGMCYEESCADSDYPLLKNYIQSQYKCWKETGMTSLHPNAPYIESFCHERMSARVNSILNKITN